MKRLVCLILLFSILLSGCHVLQDRIKEPVTFYYVRQNYQENMGEVIASEVREASGHRYDLPYLLALYSMGPSDKKLRTLLPRNVTILPVEHSEDGLVLSLLDEIHALADADFTLASACLAMTCMELIDVEQVTVICGDRSITLNRENLMLSSSMIPKVPEEAK